MKVELVDVRTDDRLLLTGAFLEPAKPSNDVPGVDVFLMMHGNGGNFYGPFYRFFAERLAEMGCASLRTNNRGHDIVSRGGEERPQPTSLYAYQDQPPRYYGVAYENLDDSRRDWRAWITYLWDRGYRNIVLWGHSRGAVKTAYYMGIENDPRIKACILGSPPWFSYSRWMQSPQADIFKAHLAEAQRYVDQGKPNALFWIKVPMEYITGAQNYLDKYGPEEKYNLFNYVHKIKCPVLALTGAEEVKKRFAFEGLDKAFEQTREKKPNLTHVSIPDGDHQYTGKQDYALEQVLAWLKEIAQPTEAAGARA